MASLPLDGNLYSLAASPPSSNVGQTDLSATLQQATINRGYCNCFGIISWRYKKSNNHDPNFLGYFEQEEGEEENNRYGEAAKKLNRHLKIYLLDFIFNWKSMFWISYMINWKSMIWISYIKFWYLCLQYVINWKSILIDDFTTYSPSKH